MNILDSAALFKSYGMKKVLQGATFTVGETEKVGFIGQNGSGKTTLFRLIAGVEAPDNGQIAFKRGVSIGYLPQDPILNADWTVAQEIESALGEVRQKLDRYLAISKSLESASTQQMEKLLGEQESLGYWLEHHRAWDTDYRINEVLLRLNIPGRDVKISLLSGGMKKRVALAKLVLQSPDLLLLDEPTNHLDALTTEWLEKFLIDYPGAVMLITHDRYFLDHVAQRIFELELGTLYSYLGGYLDYLEGRAERHLHEDREQGRLVTLLRRETAWMLRGAKARSTKSKARIERFYDMQDQRKDRVDRQIGLQLETGHRLGHTILEFADLHKSFGEAVLIRDLNLKLKSGDRIGIIGANGSGKTTLLRMILGEEQPTSGQVVCGKNTKIAYFDQKRECLDPNIKVEEALGGDGDWVTVKGERRHKTSYLGDFLFEHYDQKRVIRTLSGGEKARLILAKMMLENANMLILDEPTNDLDIPTLQLLDDALVGYNGCVLMVTHDRFFLDKVATGILSFEGEGRVRYTEGNYETYRERLKNEKESGPARELPLPARAGVESPVPKVSSPAGAKALGYKEKRELEELERAIETLEGRKKELEIFLADPAKYAKKPNALKEWAEEFLKIEQTLIEKIARWEVLEGKQTG
jgi:ATP-binding cassette subfamily F protein uup